MVLKILTKTLLNRRLQCQCSRQLVLMVHHLYYQLKGTYVFLLCHKVTSTSTNCIYKTLEKTCENGIERTPENVQLIRYF